MFSYGLYFILLLGQNTNKSLKNLLVLQLILFVVAIVILILFWGAIFGALLANA